MRNPAAKLMDSLCAEFSMITTSRQLSGAKSESIKTYFNILCISTFPLLKWSMHTRYNALSFGLGYKLGVLAWMRRTSRFNFVLLTYLSNKSWRIVNMTFTKFSYEVSRHFRGPWPVPGWSSWCTFDMHLIRNLFCSVDSSPVFAQM